MFFCSNFSAIHCHRAHHIQYSASIIIRIWNKGLVNCSIYIVPGSLEEGHWRFAIVNYLYWGHCVMGCQRVYYNQNGHKITAKTNYVLGLGSKWRKLVVSCWSLLIIVFVISNKKWWDKCKQDCGYKENAETHLLLFIYLHMKTNLK